MSKSILVIDTPTSCFSCPLRLSRICDAGKFTFVKPESCPLKPLPEKKMPKADEMFPQDMALVDRWKGWDACLNAIIGDEE